MHNSATVASRAEIGTPIARDTASTKEQTDEAVAPQTASSSKEHTEEDVTANPVHDWNDTADRYRMIAEAAYFKAERRGFAIGDDELDWLAAEEELTELMEGDHASEVA